MSTHASLRSTMAAVTVIVTVLALLVSGALVGLTTALHRATTSSSASVESVRLAEEAEIDLLLHLRARDPLVMRDIEGDLRRKLIEARSFVTTSDEARVLSEAANRVDEYIASTRDPQRSDEDVAARQDAAYGALEALVTINVAQSKESQRDAARWDNAGNLLGISIGALMILVAGAVIVWLRRHAFAPVFELAYAMKRFGRGDRDVRAAERGPKELREMCVLFNEMASAIAAQRQAQMAFLGGVAHDLRTPLATLQMSVALLGPDNRLPPEDRIRATVARLSRQIARMERMLGDFLDMAKIEAGQLELRLETHDARALVEEVVDLFEDAGHNHRLEARLPDHALLIRCDSLRIEQVVANLISNAIKYSPSGGASRWCSSRAAKSFPLSVTDYGIGISPDDTARLFEPFRRLGPSKEVVPGVGLGLFVVRRIVEAHGGRIEVQSSPGEGSTFRFLLPASRPVAQPLASHADGAPALPH